MIMLKRTYEVIELFFQDYGRPWSDSTIKSYRISLNLFFRYIKKPFDRIEEEDIMKWLNKLDEAKMRDNSKRIRLAAIRAFFRYAFEEELVEKSPTIDIKLGTPETPPPYYLSKRQLAELFEIAIESKRNRALVELAYATGARISELLSLRTEDIIWGSRQIWIRNGKGAKERFVLFNAEAGARLKEYLSTRNVESPYIFPNGRGGHLSTSWVETIFRQYSRKLGYKVTPHTLRHTFGGHLAEKNMPQSYIQELLGHRSLATTRIYTKLNAKARKIQYDSYQV